MPSPPCCGSPGRARAAMAEPPDTATNGRAFNGRLLSGLADWSRTGIVVITVVVSGIRWSSNVDSRLTSIEDKLAGQRAAVEQAVTEVTKHADMASQAAERAEAAVAD